MTIRLICLDLDGTTLRRDGTVSDRTVATLRRAMAAGATVAIATGRIHGSAIGFARRIGMNGPVISANGARVQDMAGNLLLHRPMPQSVIPAALEVAKDSDLQFDLFSSDAVYAMSVAKKRRSWLRWQWSHVHSLAGLMHFFRRLQPPYALLPMSLCTGPVDKVFISHKDPARFGRACDRLRALVPEPLTVCSSDADNLELTADGVSKGSAVAWLAGEMGLTLGEVLVAGDSMNDLSMFELDCFKVAMGNAEPEIKERASFITASHHEDGVAAAVERFVLGEAAV